MSEKGPVKQNWNAEVIPEVLTGRWMEVVWTRNEGWLNLRMGRDLVTDALCYEAFNKLWIGSSHFPLLMVTAGHLMDSWHCVHGCTCMYV